MQVAHAIARRVSAIFAGLGKTAELRRVELAGFPLRFASSEALSLLNPICTECPASETLFKPQVL
jgi:hypothetical protein